MARRSLLFVTVLAAALATDGRSAATHDDDDKRSSDRDLKATLSGFNEIPSTLSSPAKGSFRGRISRDGERIDWKLEYRDVPSGVLQAHIHFGDHHTNGGVSIFLCSNLGNGPMGTATCPTHSGRVTGTATADLMGTGTTAQGLAPGEFDELIRAIRAGRTYVNVHSSQYTGGEIRGQIKVDD